MKYFIPILLIFFFSCDDDNLVGDNSCTECISIGSEFPLGNRYAVYLISHYNTPEQYELDSPSSEEIDTLFLPFALRLDNTFLPLAVDIRSRKPCLFFLFLLDG